MAASPAVNEGTIHPVSESHLSLLSQLGGNHLEQRNKKVRRADLGVHYIRSLIQHRVELAANSASAHVSLLGLHEQDDSSLRLSLVKEPGKVPQILREVVPCPQMTSF